MRCRGAHRPARLVALIALGCLVCSQAPPSGEAGASGGGSGSAGASARGSLIVSSILWGDHGRPGDGRAGGGGEPRCSWHTLEESEVIFLLHVAAAEPELHDAALFRALSPWLEGGLAPGLELQVMFCDGEPRTDQVRVRPSVVSATEIATASRQELLTRLPPPELRTSPPASTPAVVNHPVFFWVEPAQWSSRVTATLSAGGRAVEVEAVPRGLVLYTGESGSGGRVTECPSGGTPPDPGSPQPIEVQARSAGSCVQRYTKVTGRDGRRDAWIGYAELRWRGRFRVDGGAWEPLGALSSVRTFAREVTEVPTVIEQP